MASAAVRTHFPKRVNARFMPSAAAVVARPLAAASRLSRYAPSGNLTASRQANVDEDVPALLRRTACVPDEGDVFHGVGELLADFGRIDEQESVASHRARPFGQDGLGNGGLERLVVQIPAQPLLRVYRPYVVVDRPDDR